jgi:hypothetical protein
MSLDHKYIAASLIDCPKNNSVIWLRLGFGNICYLSCEFMSKTIRSRQQFLPAQTLCLPTSILQRYMLPQQRNSCKLVGRDWRPVLCCIVIAWNCDTPSDQSDSWRQTSITIWDVPASGCLAGCSGIASTLAVLANDGRLAISCRIIVDQGSYFVTARVLIAQHILLCVAHQPILWALKNTSDGTKVVRLPVCTYVGLATMCRNVIIYVMGLNR